MAIVFISPKQRQRTFFTGITVVFLLFIIFLSLGVFLSGPKNVSPALVFNKPKVNIDMSIFDSDQFKNLEFFSEMEMQYLYEATDKNNKVQTGSITAPSKEKAEEILKSRGLESIKIKDIEIGRDNPFVPYYETNVIPPKD